MLLKLLKLNGQGEWIFKEALKREVSSSTG
jgi:hypothetical protein